MTDNWFENLNFVLEARERAKEHRIEPLEPFFLEFKIEKKVKINGQEFTLIRFRKVEATLWEEDKDE